jgi:hypothetical protein
MMGARTRIDPKRTDGGAKVVLLRREDGRPPGGLLHPKDASTSAAFHTEADGSLVLTIKSPEGRLHLEDGEGPVERRLARVLMALVARGYFSEAEHQEGLSVLWGTALDDLETEGARSAGSVVLHLMARALTP